MILKFAGKIALDYRFLYGAAPMAFIHVLFATSPILGNKLSISHIRKLRFKSFVQRKEK